MDNYNDDPIPNLDDPKYFETLTDFLKNNDDMKKTAANSIKQAMFAAGGTLVGSVLLGPVGGLVGAIVGGAVGFARAPHYNGVVQHILQLPDGERKQALLKDVCNTLVSAGAKANIRSADDFQRALVQFATQGQVRDQIWTACVHALE